MNKSTIALSLAAGLIGGMLSRYLTPMPVHAQAQPMNDFGVPPAGAQTLKLPISFVDQSGNIAGTFTMNPDGKPNIRLFDNTWRTKSGAGHVIWSARGVTWQPATGQ